MASNDSHRNSNSANSIASLTHTETTAASHNDGLSPAPSPINLTADSNSTAYPGRRYDAIDSIVEEEALERLQPGNNTGTPDDKKRSFWRWLLDQLRPDFILNHLDLNSLKTVARTSLVVWVGVILTVIPKTHLWLGNAPYLLQVTGFILAAGGHSLAFNVFMNLVTLVLTLYAWLYQVVAAGIVANLNGYPSPQDATNQIIAAGVCSSNDPNLTNCVTKAIYSGFFLRTQTTVVYIFAMIIGFSTLLGIKRSSPRLLTPGSLIAMIALVITGCYGVHFPYFDCARTLGITILRPMGLTFSLNVLCSFLIFPFTANWAFFNGISKALADVLQVSQENIEFMATVPPSSTEFSYRYMVIPQKASAIVGFLSSFDLMASVVGYELSYGRLDAGHVGEIRSHIKDLVNAVAMFENFYGAMQDRRNVILHNLQPVGSIRRKTQLQRKLSKLYKPVGEYERRRRREHMSSLIYYDEDDDDSQLSLHDLDMLLELAYNRYEACLTAANRAVAELHTWIVEANKFRVYSLFPWNWRKRVLAQQNAAVRLRDAQEQLCNALADLTREQWHGLLDWKLETGQDTLELVACGSLFGFCARTFCQAVEKFAEFCVSLDATNPVPRLITPWAKTQKLQAKLNISLFEKEADFDNLPGFVPQSNVQVRDPDALPPSSRFHLLGKSVVSGYNFLMNDHFLWCVRCASFTVLAATPNFVRTTSWWFYSKRLIWVVIMAAISTSEFTGDTIYSFIFRILYSLIGCAIGMVAWYISTGNGMGNYYGFSVVYAVLAVFCSAYRHFALHSTPIPAIVLCLSVSLVMGTSWQDSRGVTTTETGRGFEVAWIRFVSVTVGLSIGFIASIFPHPKTGKRAIRKILSIMLRQIGNVHCELGQFAMQRAVDPSIHILARRDYLMHRIRAMLAKLASTQPILRSLRYEPNIIGDWPKIKYVRLIQLESEVVRMYLSLYTIFDKVDDPESWVSLMVSKYGWNDDDLSSELFALISMASAALELAKPLPTITPAQTSIRHTEMLSDEWGYIGRPEHEQREGLIHRDREEGSSYEQKGNESDVPEAVSDNQGETLSAGDSDDPGLTDTAIVFDEDHSDIVHHRQNPALSRSRKSSFDTEKPGDARKIISHDGQLCLVGLMLSHMIYQRLDEAMLLIKGLVGEDFDVDPRMAEIDNRHDYNANFHNGAQYF